jgi:hypothetical protein
MKWVREMQHRMEDQDLPSSNSSSLRSSGTAYADTATSTFPQSSRWTRRLIEELREDGVQEDQSQDGGMDELS